MATIRDMIPAFDLFQPASVEDALALKDQYGKDGWAFAGGLDSMDWFKDRVKRPEAVIDLSGIDALKGVRSTADGIEIGAMTTLTDVASNPDIDERFNLLATAAGRVATPQIRNQATLGGNVSQDTRCWYYRGGWPCYRAGGNVCYAATSVSMNREHAVLGASRCVAVNASDTAPALIALDAKMVIQDRKGERVVDAEDYFIGPSIDIMRMTILGPGDLLTAIRLPNDWAGAQYYFEKVSDRQAWDFALVSVASAMKVSGGTIQEARIAVNGVAPYPVRVDAAEAAVRGKPMNEDTAVLAGDVSIRGAQPLRHNDYKIPLMKNLVKRSVRGTIA